MQELNKAAQELGRKSWETRSKGKTKKERSEMMKQLRSKRIDKKSNSIPNEIRS